MKKIQVIKSNAKHNQKAHNYLCSTREVQF